MFFFHHPRPFSRKEVVVQIVASKARALPDLHVLVVPAGPPAAPAPVVLINTCTILRPTHVDFSVHAVAASRTFFVDGYRIC